MQKYRISCVWTPESIMSRLRFELRTFSEHKALSEACETDMIPLHHPDLLFTYPEFHCDINVPSEISPSEIEREFALNEHVYRVYSTYVYVCAKVERLKGG
jgi:hypothetical protein